MAPAHDAAPSHHGGPPTGPVPHDEPLAALHDAPLVRIPRHAGARGPRPSRSGDGLGELAPGHRRADGCGTRAHDGRPGRGRPHGVPPLRRREPDARADHGHLEQRRPDEGPGAAARSGGQAADRAGRRADRDRAPQRGRPGREGHRPAGAGRRRALRERHQRRRAGPPLRRGRGGRRALPLRGLLAAGDRGHVVRCGRRRHHRWRVARGRGQRRRDGPAGATGRSGRAGRCHRPAARRPRAARPLGRGRPGAGGQPLHLAGHRGGNGRLLRRRHRRGAAPRRTVGRRRRPGHAAGAGAA